MKKILFSIVITLLAFNICAQNITYGAKAGLNITSINRTSERAEIELKYAFHIGVTSKVEISELFSIQAELLYSSQGYSISEVDGFEYDYTSSLNYINLPLMAIYNVGSVFSLEAGPQIGYLIGAPDTSRSNLSFYRPIDFSFNFGLGFKLNSRTSLGLRLNRGLNDISKNKDYSTKNIVAQLSFNYNFN